MRNLELLTAAVFCTATLSGGAGAAPLAASSSAAILSGGLAFGSSTAAIPPQASAAGKGPPAYSARKTPKTFKATISLPDDTSLSVKTGALADTASSAGVVGGAITAKAGSSMLAPMFTVTNPFVAGSVTVKADRIGAAAAFTTSTKGAPSASGVATITTGIVDLSLFGLGMQTYSGKPKPNAMLFRSKDGTVTVYGNRQVIGHAVGSTVPTSITVHAIDVHLAGAKVLGQTVNGDVFVGTCIAR